MLTNKNVKMNNDFLVKIEEIFNRSFDLKFHSALEPVFERLARIDERISRLEVRMDQLEKRMDRLEKDIGSLRSELRDFKFEFNAVVYQNTASFIDIESRLSELEEKVTYPN